LEKKQYRILFVDDDLLTQRMMGLVLSGEGYLYDFASTGEEAIKAVQSQHYDLILMDLQMPIMDGYEATRKIRAWEAGNGHLPIVALTAMMFEDDNHQCYEAGMDGYIIKPFNNAQLYQIIDSYLDKSNHPGGALTDHGMQSEEENPLLDIQAALPRFGNDTQNYQEFLEEFIQSLPERMEQFQTLSANGDLESLAKSAHNLKGVAASMGATQLSALAAKLDKQSSNGDSKLIEKTLEEFDKIVLEIKDNGMKILSTYQDSTGTI
jgi:two-component system, sensor histidine kinase and response regulator